MLLKLNRFFNIYKFFACDKNEKSFTIFLKNHYKKKTNNRNECIIINGYQDYYSLIFSFLLNKEKKFKNYDLVIYLPFFKLNKYNFRKNFITFATFFYINTFKSFLLNFKWKNMYSLVSKKNLYFFNLNLFIELDYLKKSEKILKECKNKLELKLLKYNNILIGDLIYDTYLRFSGEPTVNLRSPFLVEILSKTIQLHDYLKKINIKFNIKYFMSQQHSYIFHGLPFRFFQKTNVMSYHFDNRFNYLRKQNKNIKFLRKDFSLFPKVFSKLNNKSSRLAEAHNLLKSKFKGNIIKQERWMPLSVYHKKKLNINKKINAVIFMHCFVDSPTARGDSIFEDFYHWIVETLEFLKKLGLEESVIIKPHPNSQPDSIKFENFLKSKYNKFIWVDRNASNASIFKLKPKCGISVYGTVLHELAYYNIVPISAGTNPCLAYKFVNTAKTKSEYFSLIDKAIKNKNKFKININEILEMVYCYYLLDDTRDDLIAKKMNLKNIINETQSNSLAIFQKLFIKKIKNVDAI